MQLYVLPALTCVLCITTGHNVYACQLNPYSSNHLVVHERTHKWVALACLTGIVRGVEAVPKFCDDDWEGLGGPCAWILDADLAQVSPILEVREGQAQATVVCTASIALIPSCNSKSCLNRRATICSPCASMLLICIWPFMQALSQMKIHICKGAIMQSI